MERYKELNKCLCCDSEKLFLILDLAEQPPANSYHQDGKDDSGWPKPFPLGLNLCLDCGHTQLTIALNPDIMFKNYLYVSGTTKTLRDYFAWFAKYTSLKYGGDNKNVLDIACNDGSQLVEFAKLGYKAYGVDPAENLAEKSRSNGVDLTVGYWNDEVANNLPAMGIITAQNVFAHNSDPHGFLMSCEKVMNKESTLIIQTSQANMFANNEFDTIYHEHISFFCINSMMTLARRCGFSVVDVLKPEIHGTSYIFVLKLGNVALSPASYKLLAEEQRDIIFFNKWSKNANTVVSDLKHKIEDYRSLGYKVVGYGAAAKGNTLLNFGSIKLDYIVDDNEMKHGYFTPGMNIEIKSPNDLKTEDKLLVVPLAWNFFDEIKGKVKTIRQGKETAFVLYFPKINTITE
jgi:SAM-dependent methyltransferase